MPGTTVFDDFVRARSTHLLRVAYLLTRDHNHAEDLVQTALARSWSAWPRIDADPEPYVRRVLVNAYASWRGRRWHGELPSDVLPELTERSPQAGVDDRDEVWRALGRLPRQQRAVIVLRYFEDMTESQIADALSISAGTVKSHASKGLANLRMDETLRPERFPVPEAPQGTERLAAVHARIRHRRVRRVAAVTAAGLAVLALVVTLIVAPHAFRRAAIEPSLPRVGTYVDGDRVIRTGSATTGRDLSITWTPTTTDAHVLIECLVEKTGRSVSSTGWMAAPYINGVIAAASPSCEPYRSGDSMTLLRADLLRVGVPVTLTLRVVRTPLENPSPATVPLQDVDVSAAISEAVPFDDYPLPRRPAHLVTLDARMPPAPVALIRAGGPMSVRVSSGRYEFVATSQTPGSISVFVDGKLRWRQEFWTYQADRDAYSLIDVGKAGATISITTEHVTADWFVAVIPSD